MFGNAYYVSRLMKCFSTTAPAATVLPERRRPNSAGSAFLIGMMLATQKPDLTHYLRQTVTVQIDRRLGSRHPRFPDMVYPVNYGFLPNTISGDGAEIDAYVLGLGFPAQETTGLVIAVIVRDDDNEDKLIVAADGKTRTAAEINEAVAFCERYFKTRIITL